MFGDISKKLHKRVEPYTQRERKHEGQIETFFGIVQPRVAAKLNRRARVVSAGQDISANSRRSGQLAIAGIGDTLSHWDKRERTCRDIQSRQSRRCKSI